MHILGNNAAGLLNKKQSFLRCFEKFRPGVFFIQESKCKAKGQIKVPDYIIFEKIRKNNKGVGYLQPFTKVCNLYQLVMKMMLRFL